MTNATATHRASLGAILSITTGRLVSSLDDLYALQDFLVGRSLMTHERIVGWELQTSALLDQFPRLAEAEAPDFSVIPRGEVESACRAWVDSVADHIGWSEADVLAVDGCEVEPEEAFAKIFGGRA